MGNKLLFLRRARGMKQYDLANTLDVSPSFLCKIEKGLHEPNDFFKNKCADFFHEKVESIFPLSEDNKGFVIPKSELNENNNLWAVRLKKNLKQNKLADLLGCSPSYLSKVEKGLQEPNIAFKKKCAKILKIKETDLFPESKSL